MRGQDAAREEEELTAKAADHLTTRSYMTEVVLCADQIGSVPAPRNDRLNNHDLKSHDNLIEAQFHGAQFHDAQFHDDGSGGRRAHEARNGLHLEEHAIPDRRPIHW